MAIKRSISLHNPCTNIAANSSSSPATVAAAAIYLMFTQVN